MEEVRAVLGHLGGGERPPGTGVLGVGVAEQALFGQCLGNGLDLQRLGSLYDPCRSRVVALKFFHTNAMSVHPEMHAHRGRPVGQSFLKASFTFSTPSFR